MELDQKDIIEIANNKAIELGYDISKMEIKFDQDNKRWEKRFIPRPISKYDRSLMKKLKNKDYQILHYSLMPVGWVRGGGLTIFVDKNNGKVIDVIRGM